MRIGWVCDGWFVLKPWGSFYFFILIARGEPLEVIWGSNCVQTGLKNCIPSRGILSLSLVSILLYSIQYYSRRRRNHAFCWLAWRSWKSCVESQATRRTLRGLLGLGDVWNVLGCEPNIKVKNETSQQDLFPFLQEFVSMETILPELWLFLTSFHPPPTPSSRLLTPMPLCSLHNSEDSRRRPSSCLLSI